VYCEKDHCIIVPTVCKNVSRVTRTPKPVKPVAPPASSASATQGGGGGGGGGGGSPTSLQTPFVVQSAPDGIPPMHREPVPGTLYPQTSGPGWYPPTYYPPKALPGWYPPPEVIPTIPEPGTWMMTLLGLVLIGIVRRKSVKT
jgi:hypothetical protein